jgi:hypothetical protein
MFRSDTPRWFEAVDGHRVVVGYGGQYRCGEHHDQRGDGNVPPGVGQEQVLLAFRGRGPAYPGHGAPRPHSARPSVLLM